MLFTHASFYSQKKGTIYSLVLLIGILTLVVGILSVGGTSGPQTAQTFTPRWVQASAANASINLSVTNVAGATVAVQRIDIARPATITSIDCGPMAAPNWDCSRAGATTISFQYATGLAAGASQQFNINITPPAGAGNYSFAITTYQTTGGGGETNTSGSVNVSVDANPPSITLMNISTSVKNISGTETFSNLVAIFLNNASSGINVVVQVTDNASEPGNVTLTYNYTKGIEETGTQVPNYRTAGATGNISIPMFNSSFGSANIFNVTIPTSGFLNGTKVFFSILANDTVGNGNVSNRTSTVGYNFTIDAAAPLKIDVQISNISNGAQANGINTTRVTGSVTGIEYIINSTMLLNVSALVEDSSGSGVVRVRFMNRSDAFTDMGLLTGNNGSGGQTTWTNSSYNITDLLLNFAGDGVYNLTFMATDNVSNSNTFNFTVEVDNTPPTGVVLGTRNVTIAGLPTNSNVTTNASVLNVSFAIRLQTTNNINNNTANVSVKGNKNWLNLTHESGTSAGTAVWNLTLENGTVNNLTTLCDLTQTDASQCNLQFVFSDVLGRTNDSMNLTIAVDTLLPNVSIVSPVSLFTQNYTTTVLINASVNDSVGSLRNVSFRLRNSSLSNGEAVNAVGQNVTNWMPMVLDSGSNGQFSAQGYWTATFAISGLVDGNWSVEINATDSAGWNMTWANVSNIIFDSTSPTNISFFNPLTTNTFQKAMFNISINVTDGIIANDRPIAGLRNVSFRLENSSFNWPWVEASQVVTALTVDQRFNASQWNFTHFGGVATNASDGNFTIRLNVTDTAGNQNATITFNVTIDTIVPRVAIIAPTLGTNTSSVNITVSANDTTAMNVSFRFRNSSLSAPNGEGVNAVGQNVTNWMSLTRRDAASQYWNITFTTTGLTEGNWSVEINATDSAGNQNTSVYVASILIDNRVPFVQAIGPASGSRWNTNFVVNASINDTSNGSEVWGKVSNLSTAQYRYENITHNGSWTNLDVGNVSAYMFNLTFDITSVVNGVYNISFNATDTAGNQNTTVKILNVTIDNTAPSVRAFNTTPVATGGTGLSGAVVMNVTVTDNLGYGENGIDNISVNVTFINSVGAIVNSTQMTTGKPASTESWNVTFPTTALTDGDYFVYVNATDRTGNRNSTQYLSITIQNGASKVRAVNLTFQGGYLTGTSDTNQSSPTWLLNTTANATCKYSLDTPVTYYDDLTNVISNNVSRQHNKALGFLPDRAANGYAVYYACKDVSGNYTAIDGATSSFTFSVDSRNFFNVTMGSSGDNKVRGDYFAVGWNSFDLPKTTLLANTGVPTIDILHNNTYNITNVLSSLGNPTLTVANFTTVLAYNGSAWTSYTVGAVTNTFTNFTLDTPNSKYYINITVANERLEIN